MIQKKKQTNKQISDLIVQISYPSILLNWEELLAILVSCCLNMSRYLHGHHPYIQTRMFLNFRCNFLWNRPPLCCSWRRDVRSQKEFRIRLLLQTMLQLAFLRNSNFDSNMSSHEGRHDGIYCHHPSMLFLQLWQMFLNVSSHRTTNEFTWCIIV